MDEEYELFEQYRVKDDLDAVNKLILHNLRYVHHVASGYYGYSVPYPDMVQEGIIGLMKGIKAFDHKLGIKLMSYATHFIEGEIKMYIMSNYNIIKIPSSKTCKKLFFNLRKHLSETYHISNDEVKDAAIKLGINEREIHDFATRLTANHEMSIETHTASGLSQDWDSDDGMGLRDVLTNNITLEDSLIEDEQSLMLGYVSDALENLNDRERNIIHDRFLVEDKKTLQQLSVEYGVSIERIRQLESNAIKKVKSVLQTNGAV